MQFRKLHDKRLIENHFRKNTLLNLYQIGDLDDFFWKYTDWYAAFENNEVEHVILKYSGTDLPVVLALCEGTCDKMGALLYEIRDELPDKFYSHMSTDIPQVLKNDFRLEHHGHYLKMTLKRNDLKTPENADNIRRLTNEDLKMLQEFYKESYPDNWFDKRMLGTGKYFGYFDNGKLIGAAGIHVYSAVYKVATLGNITTDPLHRGKSICAKVTSALCRDLFENVDHIGLNVHSENKQAIRSYEKIGFKITAEYEEIMFYKLALDA